MSATLTANILFGLALLLAALAVAWVLLRAWARTLERQPEGSEVYHLPGALVQESGFARIYNGNAFERHTPLRKAERAFATAVPRHAPPHARAARRAPRRAARRYTLAALGTRLAAASPWSRR